MKPIGPPDTHYLEAAKGWLELGSQAEAEAELELLAPELQAHPVVLDLRWQICAAAKKQEQCVALAGALLKQASEGSSGWILRSFALHELKRTQEAFGGLRPAADLFPDIWTVPYNLACYCAQLGRLAESREWYEKALAVDSGDVAKSAGTDPDLRPLWEYNERLKYERDPSKVERRSLYTFIPKPWRNWLEWGGQLLLVPLLVLAIS